ncbi:molybdate ABC transporter substrate-binding protein [uncultured Slackia sp.]|uniref:molybdate ABC transporter substrate-binding protein n=1 Tax=uncultured Slackia sp. TaxID=665903 RepID=UPI0026DEECAF|nr:molybdate ABC transporter substrate-binding protein [uncultured Slackia sp.]
MKPWKKATGVAVCALACAALAMTVLGGCTKAAEEPAQEAPEQPAAEQQGIELQIFAANSLSKALDEVQALYTEQNPEVTFADTQYKASGELVEMLKAGSSADIFISASKGKMDDAAEAGLVDDATRFDMFVNDLVMVTSADNTDIPEGLTLEEAVSGDYTICVGDESVPAGNYACQSLATVGAYSDASGKGGEFTGAVADKVVLDTSVGNVCKHAESGDVDIAFVFSSDVYRFGGVKVLSTVPSDTHKPIVYPAAVTVDDANLEAAQAFLDWAANDPEALVVWQKWGFELA